jgi:hypothetical protein
MLGVLPCIKDQYVGCECKLQATIAKAQIDGANTTFFKNNPLSNYNVKIDVKLTAYSFHVFLVSEPC